MDLVKDGKKVKSLNLVKVQLCNYITNQVN